MANELHDKKKRELEKMGTGFYCPQPITNSPSIKVLTASRCKQISAKEPKQRKAQKIASKIDCYRIYIEVHFSEVNDAYKHHIRMDITITNTYQILATMS